MTAPAYAEIGITTNFSFLRGGSHPQDYVNEASELRLPVIGIADHNTLAGVVRAYVELENPRVEFRPKLLIGSRLVFRDGTPDILVYPHDRAAYGRLCQLLTRGKRGEDTEKGQCHLALDDLLEFAEGQLVAVMLPHRFEAAKALDVIGQLQRSRADGVWLAASLLYRGDDRRRLMRLQRIAATAGVPLLATNEVLYHHPARRPLQDVLTCIREKTTIEAIGKRLEANAERYLKPADEMARLFRDVPEAIAETMRFAGRVTFSLDQLKYQYPDEPVPPGKTAQRHLEDLTWRGAHERFPVRISPRIKKVLHKELRLIRKLKYAHYFLTVHDIVRYARGQKILCHGRGSAANSAVCYVLGVTSVDPTRINLLFERFISKERLEPPDIDVDFEHSRREEVMQYVYRRYGRHRAAVIATVIHYRPRSAIRDVGKALGLTEDVTAALADTVWGSWGKDIDEMQIRQAGLDPANAMVELAVELATELIEFPRHLSQHVGGYVLTQDRLDTYVPVGNAAMDDRTFIEWDKDDVDALNMMKVDVLALGMLTCIRKSFDLIDQHKGERFVLASVPQDDSKVYDMLCRGESLGVFQVESRAQMNMLPRLRPRVFYDLVIEVAIVRPGPIQGDMVHPYLRRRSGLEAEDYPSPHPDHGPSDELNQVLGKTMGVPLFQEQAMRLAMVAAKFSGPEANELRRAMATFRRRGTIDRLREKMVGRMTARGYPAEFAERCFNQIKGFGEYGFPESHAASFAHLVYVSAWLKCHYPAAFAAALLNSQPMGFYAPAQIVRCAVDHGVEGREVDINHSLWDCTLEPCAQAARSAVAQTKNEFALRLGMRQVDGLREDDAKAIVSTRDGIPAELNPHLFCPPQPLMSSPGLTGRSSTSEDQGVLDARLRGHDNGKGKVKFSDVRDVWRRSGVGRATLERLAAADAFHSLGLDRRQVLWEVRGLPKELPLPLFDQAATSEAGVEPEVSLPVMPLSEHVVNDYRSLRLSLKAHPMSFLRARIASEGILSCADLKRSRDGAHVKIAGVVLVRQRPGSAAGVVFMTIEDETGVANLVIWPKVLERERRVVMGARLVVVLGRSQRHEDIVHVVAERLEDRSDWLRLLDEEADSISVPVANADESSAQTPAPGAPVRTRSRRLFLSRLPITSSDRLLPKSNLIGILAATPAPSASCRNPAISISRVAVRAKPP